MGLELPRLGHDPEIRKKRDWLALVFILGTRRAACFGYSLARRSYAANEDCGVRPSLNTGLRGGDMTDAPLTASVSEAE